MAGDGVKKHCDGCTPADWLHPPSHRTAPTAAAAAVVAPSPSRPQSTQKIDMSTTAALPPLLPLRLHCCLPFLGSRRRRSSTHSRTSSSSRSRSRSSRRLQLPRRPAAASATTAASAAPDWETLHDQPLTPRSSRRFRRPSPSSFVADTDPWLLSTVLSAVLGKCAGTARRSRRVSIATADSFSHIPLAPARKPSSASPQLSDSASVVALSDTEDAEHQDNFGVTALSSSASWEAFSPKPLADTVQRRRVSVCDIHSLPIGPLAAALPPPAPEHHFIFGYGSLINPDSRARSLSTTVAQARAAASPAVVVAGLLRSWNYNCRQVYTAVGVAPVHDPAVFCTGVVIEVERPDVDLPALDAREECYDRVPLRLDNIFLFDEALAHAETIPEGMKLAPWVPPPNSVVWIYQNKSTRPTVDEDAKCSPAATAVGVVESLSATHSPLFHSQQSSRRSSDSADDTATMSSSFTSTTSSSSSATLLPSSPYTSSHLPSEQCPIPQTYVDCVVAGCMRSYGQPFAYAFVRSTHGWGSGVWADDRHAQPPEIRRYVPNDKIGEAGPSDDEVAGIDAILADAVGPAAFSRRLAW
ncbi:hypothetical protein HK405_005470 [Cladochytrium tenue]|nr:hypothetical protein HK405_005470 [Cladochytrium tenue]